MKKLILLIAIILTSCGSQQTETPPVVKPAPSKKQLDSIEFVKNDLKNHWSTYKAIYASLKIDSLKTDSDEAYRVAFSHSWGLNSYGGQPTSITFHKNADTCYVVILDVYTDTIKSVLHKVVKFIPTNYFDSIRVMFNKGTFWQHPVMTVWGDRRAYLTNSDPDNVIFEAVKNGKHKLVGKYGRIDSIPILPNWNYNFYHFSSYNKQFEIDHEKYKKNRAGTIQD